MKDITIRFADQADAEEILKIYEPFVKNTTITFEFEVPSVEEFRNRIAQTMDEYPYLVCLKGGKIAGYAYAHRYQQRAAYQWNAELSVYVDEVYQRLGIGKTLYHALMELLQLQGIRNVYGIVTSPNENSEKLHENLGFSKLGVYHSTGYKLGAWHDVILFEKTIGEYSLEPRPFKRIKDLDKEAINQIMDKYK